MSKSKQKSYGDAKVICPYYDSQETVQINCAPAVYDSSGLRVVFRSKVKKDEHMRSFCTSYCWKGCPLANSSMRGRSPINETMRSLASCGFFECSSM